MNILWYFDLLTCLSKDRLTEVALLREEIDGSKFIDSKRFSLRGMTLRPLRLDCRSNCSRWLPFCEMRLISSGFRLMTDSHEPVSNRLYILSP